MQVRERISGALVALVGGTLVWNSARRSRRPNRTATTLSRRTPSLHAEQPVRDRPAGETATGPIEQGASSGNRWWQVVKLTIADWQEDNATRLAAALAYYTLFSIAPLLLVVVAVTGFALGEEAVSGELHTQLQSFLGDDGATLVEEMIARARNPGAGIFASVTGMAALLFGASGAFSQLKDALNTIWEVPPTATGGWWGTIRSRFLSFAMVLCIGFLLLVSLVVSAGLHAAEGMIGNIIPGPDVIVHLANLAISGLIIGALFALILKYLPDAKIPWRHVWRGAALAAVLFTIGKYLFGLYLGRGTISSTYGAAGSVVVLLLWTYYSALILFLGAEFTQAHARIFGGLDNLAKTPEQASTAAAKAA